MRISALNAQKICQTITEVSQIDTLQIYLFGSRVDDHKRGGDIDLLEVCASPEQKAHLHVLKFRILGRLYATIGEQKIDLMIALDAELKTDLFLGQVFPAAQRLLP